MTANISVDLDDALLNVLCYFAPADQAASQEARALASDARVEGLGRRERVRRIVEIIDLHGWHNVRDAERLRAFARAPSPGPRRLARRVRPLARRIRPKGSAR